jgi:four helix bundle protein
MNEQRNDLRERTTDYALRIVNMYSSLPKSTVAQTLGKQALRSGTSVGAQFRESQRAKSDADFINKLESVLQEADETAYWLEHCSSGRRSFPPPNSNRSARKPMRSSQSS